MRELRRHGLTVDSILATPDTTLNALIAKVGFHKNKTRYIKETTRILRDRYNGRVPDTLDELLALPGIGPKMALLALQIIHAKVEGISVDTHVHRLSNALGWARTKRPEQTRRVLEGWVPRRCWPDLNVLLVGLGQETQTERQKLVAKCLACSRRQVRTNEKSSNKKFAK